MRHALRISLLFSLAFVVSACLADLPGVEGEARVLDVAELAEEEEPTSLVVQYSISNVGAVDLERSILNFSFDTDRRSYHCSTIDVCSIPPGSFAYGSASFPYYEMDEHGELESLELAAAFFQ